MPVFTRKPLNRSIKNAGKQLVTEISFGNKDRQKDKNAVNKANRTFVLMTKTTTIAI